ncbi:MAG: AAA family ATPase [Leadbetterella sp.]
MAEIQNHNNLIGRYFEIEKMRSLLKFGASELLAIIGRRRVGKTFLIKRVYQQEMVFHITGLKDVNTSLQLDNFVEARNHFFEDGKSISKPKNWLQAFAQLKQLLGKPKKKKRVLFFDELPWLATGSTSFLKAFDHFWNTWAIDQNVVVVICGSSASWMITNVINHKGGLHNRVTQRIHLQPFTILETEKYLFSKGINMPRKSILSLYMATGGIPYYLKDVEKGQTATQAINTMFFGKKASLAGEFENLYRALFSNYEKHILTIRALASKRMGLTRTEVVTSTGIPSGGAISEILNELETSGFIQSIRPFGKHQRETLYRLTDEYSLFYLHFIEANNHINDFWNKKYNTQTVKSWQGYAFENICLKHIEGIKNALGISGILTSESSFYKQKDAKLLGCQIDLLVDRADNAINICEMKFYDGAYTLSLEHIKELEQKRNIFQEKTKTKRQLFLTLITADGITENPNNMLIDKHLDASCLFHVAIF